MLLHHVFSLQSSQSCQYYSHFMAVKWLSWSTHCTQRCKNVSLEFQCGVWFGFFPLCVLLSSCFSARSWTPANLFVYKKCVEIILALKYCRWSFLPSLGTRESQAVSAIGLLSTFPLSQGVVMNTKGNERKSGTFWVAGIIILCVFLNTRFLLKSKTL